MSEPMGVDEAMSRVKKDKSYDKVYASLVKTEDGRRIWEGLISAYQSLKIVSYGFNVSGPDSTHLYLNMGEQFGANYQVSKVSEDDVDAGSYKFNPENSRTVSEDMINRVAWSHLIDRKAVPTFNIDPYQAVGTKFARSMGKFLPATKLEKLERSRQEPFKDWFYRAFSTLNADFRAGTFERLKGELHSLKQSQEFTGRRQAAILEQCMKDVGEVLGKYSALGDEVLKKAVQNYVVDDILGA